MTGQARDPSSPPPDPARGSDGYRRQAGPGPRVRSDVIEVHIARRRDGTARGGPEALSRGGHELLQIRRARAPLAGTWQPVMGHIEAGGVDGAGETATAAALREAREEVGLVAPGTAVIDAWALEQVHPFFIAAIDCIVLTPRFLIEVAGEWSPVLNAEHDAFRWVALTEADGAFLWPGQRAALREIERLLSPAAPERDALRLPWARR